MAPAILALLISEGFKLGEGIYQSSQSAKYAKAPRPGYAIPQSITDMLNSAKSQASQTQLPGQGLMEEQMGGVTAAGISNARQSTDSPSNLLGMTATLAGQQQQGLQQMAIGAASNYNTNQNTLRSSLDIMGDQEMKKWQWEQQEPYQNSQATAAALQKGGGENINAGLSDMAGSAMSAKSTQDYVDALAKSDDARLKVLKAMYGDKTKATPDLMKSSDLMGKASGGFTNPLYNPSFNTASAMNLFKTTGINSDNMDAQSILGFNNF